MTPDQIFLVRSSFLELEAMPQKAAETFYQRLWDIDPSTAPLFARSDMAQLGHKLMATLTFIIHDLDKPLVVLPVAQDLARRHVGYGVREAHYASVGVALLGTLEHCLGKGFTPSVAASWKEAYALLSGVMITAAYPAKAGGPA